jgi:hypothetical protein
VLGSPSAAKLDADRNTLITNIGPFSGRFSCPALKVIDRILADDWTRLSDRAEQTLRICRELGVIPFVKPGTEPLLLWS